MERKLLTKKGKETYKKCGSSVETVFGIIKSAMRLDKFLLRGNDKCDSEWNCGEMVRKRRLESIVDDFIR